MMGSRPGKKKKSLPPMINWSENDLLETTVAPWGLRVKNLQRISPDVWKIDSDRGVKKLRRSNWPAERLLCVEAFLDHLGRAGFKAIPRWIKTRSGTGWISHEEHGFFLSDWPEGNPIRLNRPEQVLPMMQTLARLHFYSVNFVPPPAGMQNNLGQWPIQWSEAHARLQHWEAARPDGWAGLEAASQEEILAFFGPIKEQIRQALRILEHSLYKEMVEDASIKPQVCHNNFQEKSLLLTRPAQIYLKDFDHCLIDLRVYDLGRFLRRIMYRFAWNNDLGEQALNAYEEIMPLSPGEREILLAYLWFPDLSISFLRLYASAPTLAGKNYFKAGLRQKRQFRPARMEFLKKIGG